MADAAGQDALLRTEGLSKSFGGVVATDNLDLTVRHGEAHAVIGPNGAGKTTLIAQLAGELAPSAGRIWFDGEDITGLPAHARVHIGIARSFQITNVLPSFTVAENVQVALRPRRGHSFVFLRDAAQDRELKQEVQAMLELVGLAGRADAIARELAYGEQRQLELAMALASAPRLLLLDEPMAGIGHAEAPGHDRAAAAHQRELRAAADRARHGCRLPDCRSDHRAGRRSGHRERGA